MQGTDPLGWSVRILRTITGMGGSEAIRGNSSRVTLTGSVLVGSVLLEDPSLVGKSTTHASSIKVETMGVPYRIEVLRQSEWQSQLLLA